MLLQKNVSATRFVEYVCLQVLPVLSEVGGDAASDVQLDLLKLLAEMVVHSGELSSVDRCTANIYDCLLASLPLTDSFLQEYRLLAKIQLVWTDICTCFCDFHGTSAHT